MLISTIREKVLNEREAEDVHTSMGSILEDVSVHTGQITPSESPFLNEALTEYTRIHKELQQVLFYMHRG